MMLELSFAAVVKLLSPCRIYGKIYIFGQSQIFTMNTAKGYLITTNIIMIIVYN